LPFGAYWISGEVVPVGINLVVFSGVVVGVWCNIWKGIFLPPEKNTERITVKIKITPTKIKIAIKINSFLFSFIYV
jgi:hypothetical protein